MKGLLFIVSILAVMGTSSGVKFERYEGDSVTITCSHKWASSNRKYFCKNPCQTDKDVLIDSDKKSSGRYQLKDPGTGVFTVEITGLTKEDAGRYWCGVDRVFGDTYNEVMLKVLDAPQTSPPPSSSTHCPTTVSPPGNIPTSNATFAAVTPAAPTVTDQWNDAKPPVWWAYLIIAGWVLLLTSAVGILVYVVLHCNVCAHPILKSQCCARRGQFEGSDCDGNPPANADSEPDYENIVTATSNFPERESIYCNQ